ncbi:MAG TPA: T9SS type A sorting domain-containing protein [Candidatus Kapabacteria bacterium]
MITVTSAHNQTVNQAVAIGCGGGFDSSGAYAGNCSIGLPCVGYWRGGGGGGESYLGLYDDTSSTTDSSIFFPGGDGVDSKLGIVMATSLFPNPTTGSFTIDASNIGNHISASLYDERGAYVLDATPFVARERGNLQFMLHGLTSGSYMLTLDDGTKRYSYKLSIHL